MKTKTIITIAFCLFNFIAYGQNFDYSNNWKTVDSLDSKSLPKSALQVVETIYNHAKAEQNVTQLVKSVIYKMKYNEDVQEDAFAKNIESVEKESQTAVFPVKPILQSMLAEMYWWYFENNRYKFYDRSQTVEFKQEDIRTWDLNRIVARIIYLYKTSLTDIDKLKITKIDDFKYILSNYYEDDIQVRPTLYDFLAHRAIDFFMNQEAGLTAPENEFIINNDDFFQPAETFVKLNIQSEDSMSFKYYAIKLFQDIVKFHINDEEPEAFADAELKRLDFVYNNSTNDLKDSLYLNNLNFLKKKCEGKKTEALIELKIIQKYFDIGSTYNPNVSELHKWYKKIAREKCLDLMSKNENVAGECKNFIAKIENKNINITLEKENVPGEPFRALANYRNTDSIYISIYKTSYKELEDLKNTYYKIYQKRYIQQDTFIINSFKTKAAFTKLNVPLPNDGDYQEHTAEIKMPSLDKGLYLVLTGTSPDLDFIKNVVNYGLTAVTNLSYVHRQNNNGSNDFYVINRKTGAPMASVKAECWTNNYDNSAREYLPKLAGRFLSDSAGYFNIAEKDIKNVQFYIDFSYNGDNWSTNNYNFWYPEYSFYSYTNTNSRNITNRTFFFTDRAIYRPGQTIYFKGIVIETDGWKHNKISTSFHTTIQLMDVNWQQAASVDLTTNEYGTFNGSFTAPTKGLNGKMTITDGYGSTSISVEDYKRPKFEVKFDTIGSTYKLGEMLKVPGRAIAYSGASIDNALVSYRVVRQTRYPWWYDYWWFPRPSSPEKEIIHGKVKTNSNGIFEINFKAVPDLNVPASSDPVFSYKIIADVTDINGETHSNTKEINVGYKALVLRTDIPSKLVKSENTEFTVLTQNLNGEFVPASGNISIFKLTSPGKVFRERKWNKPDKFALTKEEFYKEFPNDMFNDEKNPTTWAVESNILNSSFNTAVDKKLNLSGLGKWKNGMYKIVMQSKDKSGSNVEETFYFTLCDVKDKSLPFLTTDWFTMIKGSGEPGESAKYIAGSGYESTHVLIETEFEEKIIDKKWITINNEQKSYEIPLKEDYRGNIGLHYTFIKNNRLYTHDETIVVPFTNKMLDIKFETFRNKLQPGEKEQWRLRISGKDGEKASAEMVATLYDASLDAFVKHAFDFGIYPYYSPTLGWNSTNCFQNILLQRVTHNSRDSYGFNLYRSYYALNWFNFYYQYYGNNYMMEDAAESQEVVVVGYGTQKKSLATGAIARSSAPKAMKYKANKKDGDGGGEADEKVEAYSVVDTILSPAPPKEEKVDLTSVAARTNLNETAFFYPQLQTDENGDLLVNFTMPEALTKWKMLGFAHTKDLKYGLTENELVTQKDLMITPNAPRFFREGDTMTFTAKVTSLSDKDLKGAAQLMLFDATTMKPVDKELQNTHAIIEFSLNGKDTRYKMQDTSCIMNPVSVNSNSRSINLNWNIIIPEGIQAITYRVVAKAGNFSDGEEMSLPVLTNRMLVTETMPLPVKGKQTKTFTLEKLAHNTSTTLRNHKLTLEYTANPAWYAIQALPYLMEYPYECAEQTFSRFYANSIASHIANSSPRIKQVFDSWKNFTPDALLSNLEKNQDLKSLMLEETPWVLDAKDESERKQRVALLFDLNRMADELGRALDKLEKVQLSNGGFPWFQGMPDDRYITQHIVCGLGKLDHLGIKNIRTDETIWNMVKKAIQYTDSRIVEDYKELLRLAKAGEISMSDNHLGYTEIHYLYARSFFKDLALDKQTKEAVDYYISQEQKYWLNNGIYMEAMIALNLCRNNDIKTPPAIMKSIKEHALYSEELGMYFKSNWGWYWYQEPIETQAMMIEAFDEVSHDEASVNELKVWLIKQKQTQDWKTTKATVEACYALLLRGTNWLSEEEPVDITVGNIKIEPQKMPDIKVEAGTGYFKTSWTGDAIKPEMATVTIKKTTEGVSWGALYWQYFEQLDKITSAETPLKLNKKLFVERITGSGPVIVPISDTTHLKPGDLVKVRIELRVDRDMEYVHMKDMRAAGFEPINVLSEYKWQDGLGYYESTRDAATNFFFSWLPKGTYVFEYPLRITHYGNFSNGITTIQCMYAPEFTSHSEGTRVTIR
jgi:Bacterial Alpha-2-macroglobulin MG10 domain/Alpha-2-macroglobulin family/MG2 domain